jgi:hypothetical protein
MAPPTSTQPNVDRPGLIRRVGWVLLGTIGMGVLIAPLYLIIPTRAMLSALLLSAIGLGLVSGLLARQLLAQSRPGLQFAAATGSLALVLIALRWLMGGLTAASVTRQPAPDFGALGLLLLGWATSWLALRAWNHVPWSGISPSPTRPRRATPRSGEALRRHWSMPWLTLRLPGLKTWGARIARARQRRRRAVVLLGEVEHRCPYCLEIVEPHDRRGVVVCPQCKTRHHADCWAITGTCQVPHRQPL